MGSTTCATPLQGPELAGTREQMYSDRVHAPNFERLSWLPRSSAAGSLKISPSALPNCATPRNGVAAPCVVRRYSGVRARLPLEGCARRERDRNVYVQSIEYHEPSARKGMRITIEVHEWFEEVKDTVMERKRIPPLYTKRDADYVDNIRDTSFFDDNEPPPRR